VAGVSEGDRPWRVGFEHGDHGVSDNRVSLEDHFGLSTWIEAWGTGQTHLNFKS
jgi:hypothetical protein